MARDALNDCLTNNVKEWTLFKNHVRNDLSKYFYDKTKRKPIVFPVVMNVRAADEGIQKRENPALS